MATNTELIVSQLEGIKQTIVDKFGDDGLKKKNAPSLIASAEQRLWQELAAIREAIQHTTGGGSGGGIDAWFATIAERDVYYTTNPDKLRSGTSCTVGSPVTVYTYDGTQWITGAIGFKGEPGAKGDNLALQTAGGYIQWKVDNATDTWHSLVPLSAITGNDGREIELQSNGTYIQWRYVNDTNWTNLTALSLLKGAKGDKGDNGKSPYIGLNGNWYVYNDTTGQYEDSGQTSQGSGGGSGGTTNYNDLSHKPKRDGTELNENSTASALGLATASALTTHTNNGDLHVTAAQKTAWDNKQAALSQAQQDAVNSGITAQDKDGYDGHLADMQNPHETSFAQTAAKQNTTDAVVQFRLYVGTNAADNKILTAGEIASMFAGGVRFKGRIKYGAATVTDMESISSLSIEERHGLAAGDRCGVHATQLTYEFDGTDWNTLPHGADTIGDLYKIDYYYGTVDGETYKGEVQAEIICSAVTPSVVYELFLDLTILREGDVTDQVIGNRSLQDEAADDTLVAVAGKTLTAWLQGIRNNLKYLITNVKQLVIDIVKKANMIVQQQQGSQTMFDYFHLPVPSSLELPAGTTHTTTITEADIQEIQPYVITTGITPANPAMIRFSSVSGDFYVEYRVTPGRRPAIDGLLMIMQKQPDGNFSGVSIYSGPYQGGGTIDNKTVTQIDWLQFANYDMAFDVQNMTITLAQVRELNLWKHISRSILVESTKDMTNVRDDMLGEMTSMRNTLQNKDMDLERMMGFKKGVAGVYTQGVHFDDLQQFIDENIAGRVFDGDVTININSGSLDNVILDDVFVLHSAFLYVNIGSAVTWTTHFRLRTIIANCRITCDIAASYFTANTGAILWLANVFECNLIGNYRTVSMFGCPRMHVGSYGVFSASGDYYNSVGSNTRVEPTYNVFIHRIRNKGYFSISDTTKFTFDDIQVSDGDGVYKDARYGLGVTRITGECDEGRRMIFERRYVMDIDYGQVAVGAIKEWLVDGEIKRSTHRLVATNMIQGGTDSVDVNSQNGGGYMEHTWVSGLHFTRIFRVYCNTNGITLTVGIPQGGSASTALSTLTIYARFVKWA
jgi:hypothetical protein